MYMFPFPVPAFLLSTIAWVCRSWGRECYDLFFKYFTTYNAKQVIEV
ncbi:hypothetical protein LOK49_LG09G01618 [Camellia lanceoleosa]|uniref:Uncharacterized protein n=1 Tax=Camellia lanceoleosa TaxID=1840588 RepID=A0ACC0GNY2_9ERIC|nr:hypothetical protein LOK49_LG09G01618 [Camellia lanceoleosa]